MQIELGCEQCGANRFAFPEGEGDHALVTCEECGSVVGSMRALKDAGAGAVLHKQSTVLIDEIRS